MHKFNLVLILSEGLNRKGWTLSNDPSLYTRTGQSGYRSVPHRRNVGIKWAIKIASVCMENPTGLDLEDHNIQIILYNGADLINAILPEK